MVFLPGLFGEKYTDRFQNAGKCTGVVLTLVTLEPYRRCPGRQGSSERGSRGRGTFDKGVRSEPLVRRAGCRELWVLNGVFARTLRGEVHGPIPKRGEVYWCCAAAIEKAPYWLTTSSAGAMCTHTSDRRA